LTSTPRLNDPRTIQILFWKQGAVEHYGWTRDEAIGQSSRRLLQTQFPASCQVIETELLHRGRWDSELIHTTRSGVTKVFASRWVLQRDENGTPRSILEINNDITQQKQAEQSLQQALSFSALLKQIMDQVRDSLDEPHILQTVVDSLAIGLQVTACNTGLYDLERGISEILAESATVPPSKLGHTVSMKEFPEGYRALLEGQSPQFCGIQGVRWQITASRLACPVSDDQGVLGDLWLFRQPGQKFNAFEVRLVEQGGNPVCDRPPSGSTL